MITDEMGFPLVRDLSSDGVAVALRTRMDRGLSPFNKRYILADDVVSSLADECGVSISSNIASRALSMIDGVHRYSAKVNVDGSWQTIFGIGDGHADNHLEAVAELKRENGEEDPLVGLLLAAIASKDDAFKLDIVTSSQAAEWLTERRGSFVSPHAASRALTECGAVKLGQVTPYGYPGVAYAIRNADSYARGKLSDVAKYLKNGGVR